DSGPALNPACCASGSRQQPAQDLEVEHLKRLVGPSLGGGHSNVERLACAAEPSPALVAGLRLPSASEVVVHGRPELVGEVVDVVDRLDRVPSLVLILVECSEVFLAA